MPLARISLRRGRDAAWLHRLSQAVQRALVESFEVPPSDCFQILHQHEADELIFDPLYSGPEPLSAPRSADFILIALTAGRVRSLATKQAFYRRLTELLAQSNAIAPQDVMVIINITGPEDWSFGDGKASLVPPAPSNIGDDHARHEL